MNNLPQQPIHVLLVEDNPADARLLIESLKDVGPEAFRVTHVLRLSVAIEALTKQPTAAVLTTDIVALDLSLPDSTGLDTVRRLQAVAPGVPIVVLTGLQNESLALQAVRQGVQDYLVKGQCEGGLAARALRYAVERRRAEAALQESEARLRAIVDTAVDSVTTIDERGIIESVNPATERLFGYTSGELVGNNVSLLMPEPYGSEHDGYLRNYLKTGERKIIGLGREVVGRRKDGSIFPLDLAVSEFRIGEKRMFTGIIHDASNRRRLEREILETSANEQRRIGHDLHDGLCQQILGASFGLEVHAQRLEKVAPDHVPAVRKLLDLLNDTLTQARALAHGLNPIDLRAGGLAKALHDLVVRVSGMFQTDCRFEEKGHVELTDANTATHLFRIGQEAISNAIKHGRAKHIYIVLEGADGNLTLTIRDDGKGLPATPINSEGRGLQIMQYRAAMVGATLAVRPGREGGVLVTVSLRQAKPPEKAEKIPRRARDTTLSKRVSRPRKPSRTSK